MRTNLLTMPDHLTRSVGTGLIPYPNLSPVQLLVEVQTIDAAERTGVHPGIESGVAPSAVVARRLALENAFCRFNGFRGY